RLDRRYSCSSARAGRRADRLCGHPGWRARAAAGVVSHLRDRGALRLQPHDAETLDCRYHQGRANRRRAGHTTGDTGAVADGARRNGLFDSLISRLAPEEIEAVLAHELGHFKLKHVLKRTTWFAAGSLALLALLGWLVGEPWFYAGLGVPGSAPRYGVALVLFMLALPAFTFLASPLAAMYSRRHEFEADRYAARNASAPALVTALVKLYEDNASTLTPDPLHSAFFDSHPPAPARIARLERAGA